jgi:hypothetical protein
MDILVRLATEPPDLAGVPEELSGLVAACLERLPRMRPSDAAILGKLGSFALPAASGHGYLPESAMAVIAEYLVVAEFQHHPRLAAEIAAGEQDPDDEASAGSATDDSGASVGTDVTDGSHTPLPGFESLAAFPQASHSATGFPAGRWSPGAAEPPGGSEAPAGQEREPHPVRRRRRRASTLLGGRVLLPLWARVLAAVVLVAAGVGIGVELRGSGAQAAAGNSPGPVAQPPPSCTANVPGTTPELCVSQPYGDGDTVYVIHGSGFPPLTPVTVRLDGVGVSPDRPIADLQGTFSYAIDQGHLFFRGPIPPGNYHVVVTASSGRSASASFTVNKGAAAGPPPGPPGPP